MRAMRLFKYPNGYWYVEFKRGHNKSLRTKNEEIAQKTFKKLEREHLEGRLIQLEKSELCLFGDFKKEYLGYRKDKKPNTQRADKLSLQKFLDYYGNRPMAGITPKKLDKFRAFLINSGLQKSSVNNHIRHLKGALRTAIRWGHVDIKKNPLLLEDFKQFKVDKRKPVYMTKKEVRALLKASQEFPVMKVAIPIMVFTGCGRAEIMSTLYITEETIAYRRVKTGRMVTIAIADELRPYIAHLKPGLQRVVSWKNPRTYSKYFAEVVKKANEANEKVKDVNLAGITPHKVRHTFATHLLNNDVDLKTISELLGHSSIHITADLYTHLEDKKKKRAVNKLKY